MAEDMVFQPAGAAELPASKLAAKFGFASWSTKDVDFGEEPTSDELEGLYGKSLQNFTEGEVVQGTVVEMTPDRVLVDIGYKSEGIIPMEEFGGMADVKVGDPIDVYIEKPENEDGMPVLSKQKADRIKNWTQIQRVYEQDGTIQGRIVRRVKGGFKVDIGVDAFMPASQLTWRPTGDLDKFLGETMEVKIIKLTKRRRNVVVSRRKVLEEQRATDKSRLLGSITVNQVIPGEVKNITDFGAFVDVGGIDGLLHVTDMSWGRVKHPSQVVTVGQKIDVMVLHFDPQTERISLGLKQKSDNPWKTAAERYPIASIVRGKVVSMTDYGAFVQLEEGIEGMVHVSEMSWTRRVRHPNEMLTLDQEVDVMILSVDPEAEKIALGIKQTMPNPWSDIADRYPVSSTVKGTVRNLTDYGAFIQIEEGIDALLHVSDLSWTKKVNHPSEVLERNQLLEVKVLSIDPANEKIAVGLKQMEEDPWLQMLVNTPIGSHIEVEITKLVSFGAFARLTNGVEGLIHVSEVSTDRVQKPEEVLSIGQMVSAKVIGVDPVERKIALSIREYQRDLDSAAQAEYGQSSSSVSVADTVGDAVPRSMFQAGRSLSDVANEMLAAMQKRKAQGDAEKKAADEAAAPVAEEAAPVVEEAAPVVEEVAPVAEEAAPVAEEAAPVAEAAPAEAEESN